MQFSISQTMRLIHIGFVCRNIDVAMPRLATVLGVQWAGGAVEPWQLCVFGEERDIDMRIAHAKGVGVNYELIEMVDNTPWQSDDDIAQHHLCFYSPKPAEDIGQLLVAGYRRVLGRVDDLYGYFQSPEGMLIEVIDDTLLSYLDGYYAKSMALSATSEI